MLLTCHPLRWRLHRFLLLDNNLTTSFQNPTDLFLVPLTHAPPVKVAFPQCMPFKPSSAATAHCYRCLIMNIQNTLVPSPLEVAIVVAGPGMSNLAADGQRGKAAIEIPQKVTRGRARSHDVEGNES